MNIFKILSSGDGRLMEPNVSSLLAYFLDPNEDHGLGSRLLERFLNPFACPSAGDDRKFQKLWYAEDDKVFDLSRNSRFNVVVTTEVPVFTKADKKRDVDIVVEIWTVPKPVNDEQGQPELLCVLAIENKIRSGSISGNGVQLRDEMEGLENKYWDDQSPEDEQSPYLGLIFLTRDLSDNAQKEFKAANNQKGCAREHFLWTLDRQEDAAESVCRISVCRMLQELLDQDAKGEADPIHNTTRLIILSFINFVITNFKSYREEKAEKAAKRDGDYSKRHREFGEKYGIAQRAEELQKYLKEQTSLDFKIDSTNPRWTKLYLEMHGVQLAATIPHQESYSVLVAIWRKSYARADREQLLRIAETLKLCKHQDDNYACLPEYDGRVKSEEDVLAAVRGLKTKLDSLSVE